MINKSRKLKFLSLPLAVIGLLLASGESARVFAQRDPFSKPAAAAPRTSAPRTSAPASASSPAAKPKPAGPSVVTAPPIQDRIAYYKRLREAAALNNQPLPKVTSVLTLDEMSVTGIFHTPRGYAAMVEAKPIKLSYTIYPGEKFFDGQLVAIEENKLVFRKVTKMTNGKFIAAEENKTLREYTVDQEVQGTAPVEPSGKTESAANAAPANPSDDKTKPANSAIISSPLEEMNKQAAEPKDSAKSDKKVRASSVKKSTAKASSSARKTEKKSVKVATNTDQ
ncbi:MAG: hypothetical protein ACR2N3_06680 [Pyrinomonadaceae bacterium]